MKVCVDVGESGVIDMENEIECDCGVTLHQDDAAWNVTDDDLTHLKQRIANGESAKNVIEDAHCDYRCCVNCESDWREELYDYERRRNEE